MSLPKVKTFPPSSRLRLESKVHGHFGRAPYFIIVRLKDNAVRIEDFYYNEFLARKRHIGLKVIKAVIRYKLDLLFTAQIGEISFYALKDNFVDIYRIEEGLSVKEVIESYRQNKLQQIVRPTHPFEESQVEDA